MDWQERMNRALAWIEQHLMEEVEWRRPPRHLLEVGPVARHAPPADSPIVGWLIGEEVLHKLPGGILVLADHGDPGARPGQLTTQAEGSPLRRRREADVILQAFGSRGERALEPVPIDD